MPCATATFEVAAGETVTCTFTNTALATITVAKVTDPAGGTGFDFTADSPFGSGSFTLDDGETEVLGSLPPGETYTFTETVPAGYELSDISCVGTDGAVVDLDADAVAVTPDAGEDVTCTFTNTALGPIVVAKATDPAGGTGFTFSGDAAGTIADGETITVTDLAPGTYTSTETLPDGWVLSSIVCDDTDSSGDVPSATATFEVAAGETVTCTFTTTVLATIPIAKTTDPAGGTGFAFSADSACSSADCTTETGTNQERGSNETQETKTDT